MGGGHSVARLLAGLLGIAGAWGSIADQAQVTVAWRARVSPKLLSLYDSSIAARSASASIQADVQYDCYVDAPTGALTAAGLSIESAVKIAPFCVVEGWITPGSLPGVAAVAGVQRVTVPSYAVHPHLKSVAPLPSAGSTMAIDSNGVKIVRADQFVALGSTGAGAKVGVQSGGISNLSVIQTRGELPAVQVVQPSDGATSSTGDEGTVLLEEVHALAPGAALAYCGSNTYVEYTSCLSQLIAAGANILVDDIIFPQENLLSADSPQVQAVEQLLAQNPAVTLLTAAGNYNGSYWQGNYSPVSLSSLGRPPLTCPSGSTTQTDYYVAQFGADPSQILTVLQSSSIPVALAWADPPNQNASKFDVYWVNSADSTASGCLATGTATDNQVSKNYSLVSGTYTLYIGTPDASAAGKFLKLWVGGDGLTSISKPTVGSVVTPQAFASGAVSVGAVNGSDGIGHNIESFSSLGPVTFIFPSVQQIQAPILVAPDGINVDAAGTYFAGDLFPDGNFYGTSAAAPNAAGVAALIRGAFPRLSASQLVAALKAGATQLGSTPPDGTFGYGRVDAMGALGTFPAPTITPLPSQASLSAGSASPGYSFTVSGTGDLHFSVTSSDASIIPASVVAAGSAGVTIAPSDCGVTTLTCSLSVMPASGPGGTVNLTIAAVDGASRSASSSIKVTVTGNQPAPNNTTPSPAPGSGGGGGALDAWVLIALLLLVTVRPHVAERWRARMTANPPAGNCAFDDN